MTDARARQAAPAAPGPVSRFLDTASPEALFVLSAVAQYVFHDKQQLGTLRVRDGVITLESMYFADEIRPTDGILPKRRPRVDKNELAMAETPIDRFTS